MAIRYGSSSNFGAEHAEGAENTFPITTCVLRGQLPAALTKSTAQVFRLDNVP